MYTQARLTYGSYPWKCVSWFTATYLVTKLKCTFHADAVSWIGCGISGFRGRIRQFVLVHFIHTLFRELAVEAPALKEFCVAGRGQAHLTGSEISAKWHFIPAADRLALFLKYIINKLLPHNKRGIKVSFAACLLLPVSHLWLKHINKCFLSYHLMSNHSVLLHLLFLQLSLQHFAVVSQSAVFQI